MKWLLRCAPFALALWACLVGPGCLPSSQSQLDEEKQPHFMRGKSQVNAMNYKGAIESFEKALEVNPRSASAHFELGWLYDQKGGDPAAAIFHYERYLKLRPKAGNADQVPPRILACKQALARTVSLGPVTQTLQREFEQLSQSNKRLGEELEMWKVAYTNLARAQMQAAQGATSNPPRALVRTNVQPLAFDGGSPSVVSNASRSVAAAARTHTVKSGETATIIARKYGVKLDDLMAANPRAEWRRLRPGQTLTIPGS